MTPHPSAELQEYDYSEIHPPEEVAPKPVPRIPRSPRVYPDVYGAMPNPAVNNLQNLVNQLIQDHYLTTMGQCVIRHFNGRWYKWQSDKGRYVEVPEDWIRADLYHFFMPNLVPSKCKSIMEVLAAVTEVEHLDIPVFLNPHLIQAHKPQDIISFSNGFLDIEEYNQGLVRLHDATPHWFCLESTDYPFDPRATCPRWEKCLDEWFGTDQSSKDLLQEWFGYCLTSDTRAEKMLIAMGAPGTGKSTMMLALQYMLGGRDRVGSTTLEGLNSQFGLQPIMGRNVVQLQEVRSSWTSDNCVALQKLISIIGRDPQYVDRKRVEGLSNVVINTKFMLGANSPPRLPDNTGALMRRLIAIDFDNGINITKNPDPDLKNKLKTEAPGILLWALQGLRRLRANNLQFTVSPSGLLKKDEIEAEINPVSSFVKETLDLNPTASVDKKDLYDFYVKWHNRYSPGRPPMSMIMLNKGLKGACANKIKEFRPTIRGNVKGPRQWLGVSIKKEALDDIASPPSSPNN